MGCKYTVIIINSKIKLIENYKKAELIVNRVRSTICNFRSANIKIFFCLAIEN